MNDITCTHKIVNRHFDEESYKICPGLPLNKTVTVVDATQVKEEWRLENEKRRTENDQYYKLLQGELSKGRKSLREKKRLEKEKERLKKDLVTFQSIVKEIEKELNNINE